MNNLAIITGFKEFLKELNETSDKKYDVSTSSSIFQYDSEFKQYLHNNLNIDTTSIFSKSVDEIMDMELVDGQFVEEEEYENSSLEEMTNSNQDEITIDDTANLEENNSTDETINQAEETSSTNTSSETEVKTENNPTTTTETESTNDITKTTEAESANNTEVTNKTEPKTEEDSIDEALKQLEESFGETADENFENVMYDILDSFLQDENIKSYFNDKDGELDETKIETFFNRIKGNDNDRSSVSLKDFITGIKQVMEEMETKQQSELLYGSSEMTREERLALRKNKYDKEDSSDDSRAQESSSNKYSNKKYSSSPAGGASGASGAAGGASGASGSKSSDEKKSSYESLYNSMTDSTTNSESYSAEMLENMSKDELYQKLATSQGELSQDKEKYANVANETDSALQAEKQNVDDLYSTYEDKLEEVDTELKEELDKANEEVEAQKDIVAQKDTEITEQQATISSLNSSYESACANTANLEAQLSQLQSAQSGASEEESASIANQIAALQSQINSAKQAEETAKTQLEEAKTQLDTMEQEKTEQETILAEKEEVKEGIEEKSEEMYPELEQYLDKYNEAKSNYETQKQTALSDAKASVQNDQNNVNAIQKAIDKIENEEKTQATLKTAAASATSAATAANNDKSVNSNTSDAMSEYDAQKGEALVDAALSRYGNKTQSGGMCGKGVGLSIQDALGYRLYGNGCDWGKNLAGRSDWTEITSEVSSQDLKSLPAGAVVSWSTYSGSDGQWGHVCIADGKGNEISDYKTSMVTDYYLKRGATYRVFIPT